MISQSRESAWSRPEVVEHYLAKASPRFQEAFRGLETMVKGAFPNALPVFEYKMPGWRIPRPKAGAPRLREGTIDPDWVHLFLVERKSGITLHLWNPADYYGLERYESDLSKVGLKVMRGCVQFHRKGAFPVSAIEPMLKGVKASL